MQHFFYLQKDFFKCVTFFRVSHKLVGGKEGIIEFKTGSTPAISKSRQNGHLLVVSKFLSCTNFT